MQIRDWISDGYILSTKKFCTSRKSTKYQTLNDAKMSCFLDEECSTVYDKSCDGPPYYHCKKSSSVKSSKSSCLYSSPTDEGMFLYFSTRLLQLPYVQLISFASCLVVSQISTQTSLKWHWKCKLILEKSNRNYFLQG